MSRFVSWLPFVSVIFVSSVSFAADVAGVPAQQPVAIAPTPMVAPAPAPVVATPAVVAPEKKVEVAPQPPKDPKELKKLRDEIIYRTNLGRGSDVKILLEKGAVANETNDAGVPLISLAASRSDSQGVEVVKVLMEAGADINKVDTRGKNALFYAAKSGNKSVVEYLLAKKIHYSAVDNAGNNARVIAYQTGNNEIVEILDNFVRGQNDVVRKQYEEANKEIAERYKAYNEKMQEQIKKETDEQEKIRLASSKTGAIQGNVHDLASTSCAASYWQFCDTVGQRTQFSKKDILNNINTNNTRANELANTLVKIYYVKKEVAENIMTVSADTIKAQLSEYSSNEERADDGIGTFEDMSRRCKLIADTWQATPKKASDYTLP